ncbi:putative nucleotidyltransferase [Salana multivorans]|uniref:Putative nucleotidyltransferase n=1 Tax=Salana multivorans TaxID=120377 RepID=A0A3N2DAI6_9MICO|nr:nucleotidyltransferase domain-containing protein [Salana multivorans]MBN8881394.1 nucleotidyltransferase domain-containing protein [Salana multivorans]OJX96961.1 MAG: hypothetical protein BGO96_02535 [Micrococcales bacterium 73-15]ROR96805.1 putative nucleotidyltransferase [Salana multivorans]
MRLQNPFAAIAPTGLDSQVLTILSRTEQHLTVDEIHRLLPESGSSQGVRNSVARLTDQGVLDERIHGRVRAYALNRDHLLAPAVLQIADAKTALIARMSQAVAEWPVQPLTVAIFGSAARGDMQTSSDIDVLVVAPDDADEDTVADEVARLAHQVSRWTGNDVRPLVYRATEVAPAGVFDSVLREGIDVAGDPTWLRRHLRRRAVDA